MRSLRKYLESAWLALSYLTLALALVGASLAQADVKSERIVSAIDGSWVYDGFIYRGERYPNPNPGLRVVFTFYDDGTHRLYWSREGEPGFCERRGPYKFSEGITQLYIRVDWVNPDNHMSCASDPDMQIGRESTTAVSLTPEHLVLHMQLDGQPFYYLLKPIPVGKTALRKWHHL